VKRIGYAKLGRSMQLDLSKGDMAGNAEALNVLIRLAKRNPDIEWYIIGKNNGGSAGLPKNVINPWPDGISRSPWLHANGEYRCAFCKTAVANETWDLTCCDRSREVTSAEEYVKALIMRMDALVMQVGQHGVVHAPIPFVDKTWSEGIFATPYAWARNYGHYLIDGVNRFCDAQSDGGKGKVVWLTADPRNFFKARDIKWPTGTTEDEPVLAQYQYKRDAKHERYLDPRTPSELGFKAEQQRGGEVWKTDHYYRYSGLELAILPDDWDTWGSTPHDRRNDIVVATTAAYLPDVRMRRSVMVQRWIFDQFPDAPVFGKWSDKSLADVTGKVIENNPLDFPSLLALGRATISLPATGTITNGMNWVVAKPFQCFAARTACFFVPPVDSQGWVVPNTRQVDGSHRVADGLWSVRDDWTEDELQLARWLRVDQPEQLKRRVEALNDEGTWLWITNTQRALLQRRWDEHLLETLIEQRLGLEITE